MNAKEKEIFNFLNQSETTLYPSRSKITLHVAISLFSIISIFIGSMFISFHPAATFDNIKAFLYICLAAYGGFWFYKIRRSAFSIRMNIFGMAVTNFSKPLWFRWNTIHEFQIWEKRNYQYIAFKTDDQLVATFIQDVINGSYTFLPKNYDITDHAMIKLMSEYKSRFEELGLENYPALETEAMKMPPIITLWGRRGAKVKT